MSLKNIRLEVMRTVEASVGSFMDKFLIPVDKIWQPADFLPDSRDEDFFDKVRVIQEESKELGHDFWVVLVGDMITEEALPSYESWLMDMEGVDQHAGNSWSSWVRHWSGEENRHGDLLNKFLYLSGRVDMKKVEQSTQHLINDGFDPGTDKDPYKNFIYTAFQELATYVSHKRVGELAAAKGNKLLSRICKTIAGDEMRHHLAYRSFVQEIIKMDASEIVKSFAEMMKKKIVMPAFMLKETGRDAGVFDEFSLAAQRTGVYTSHDYVDILQKLLSHWDIEHLPDLTAEAEKARDYLMNLPNRLTRISQRMTSFESEYRFQWISTNGM